MDYEKIVIVGRVGKQPELRYTPSGKAVVSFPVAVNKRTGDRKVTKWFRVSVWDKQAENCNQYLQQGQEVLVEGELQADDGTGGPHVWTRQDGSVGASFELTASVVRFGARADGEKSGSDQHGGDGHAGYTEDDVPF